MKRPKTINRGEFLRLIGTAAAVAALPAAASAAGAGKPGMQAAAAKPKVLFKGFNLLNKFNPDNQTTFGEEDFEIMAEWGFNFARIPLSYWCWTSRDNWYEIDEKRIAEIDRAVELGRQYGIHINLNFHRAPDYCINPPHEDANLFESDEALKACEHHWELFAERYRSYSSKVLSFNLINEAPSIEDAKYENVIRHLIETIRRISPTRTIIVDGLDVGNRPLMEIADLRNIIQSGRGYQPMLISHYEADWVYGNGPMPYPREELSWPLHDNGKTYDREWLRETLNHNWLPWMKLGRTVHIGEFGCHNRTPHEVALAWLEDNLSIFAENGWGWSLWNLYGSFGVMDSGRSDVKYEDYRGHKLDRRMLELLLRYK